MTTQPAARDEREELRRIYAVTQAKSEARKCRTLDEAEEYKHVTAVRILSCNEPDAFADAVLEQGFRRSAPQESTLTDEELAEMDASGGPPQKFQHTLRQATTPSPSAEEAARKFFIRMVSDKPHFEESIELLTRAMTDFAAARMSEAVEREREACAQTAEYPDRPNLVSRTSLARAIRARKP